MLELNGNSRRYCVGILHSASISNPIHGSVWLVQILSTTQLPKKFCALANEVELHISRSFASAPTSWGVRFVERI